jgi:hypothetical protein
MRSPFIRIGMALATASVSLLPFAAHAQYSGTNGQIFFSYSNTAGVIQIAAANPDGTEPHMVVNPGSTSGDVVLLCDVSASGAKILYIQKLSTDPSYSLIVANADGTSPTTLFASATNLGVGYAGFSADGTKVYFNEQGSAAASADLYSVPVTGGTPTSIVTAGSNESFGKVFSSLANSKIYFVKYTSGVTPAAEVDSANADGTGVASVYTGAPAGVFLQDISPDGTKLLVRESVSGKNELFTVNASTGLSHTALVNISPNQVTTASYSPDGTRLFYSDDLSGGKTVAADGTGTPVAFRNDAISAVWSLTAPATVGTYPGGLVLGLNAVFPSGGTGTGGGTGAPTLPDAGHNSSKAPIALAIVATLAVIGIEAGRRVRIRR